MTTINSLSIEDAVTEENVCKFCGTQCNYTAIPQYGSTLKKMINVRCTCGQATEFYKKYDKQKQEEREQRDREEIEQIQAESRMVRIAKYKKLLGRRFAERTFENFDKTGNESVYNLCFQYAKDFTKNKGEGLMFLGSVGTGKTHLAASISNYIITQHTIPVKFGNVTSLLAEIKSTYEEDSKKVENDLIRELSDVELLVIDDLGKEKGTEWSNSMIYRIINNRYENYKPLIITSNYKIEEMENNIGEATMSRIIEMCDGIKMNGEDIRKSRLI